MSRLTAAFSAAVLVAVVHAQSAMYGQCGGEGWTGATTCVSGAVCTVSNPYYSQCLPGTATTTVASKTATSTSSGSTSTSTSKLPYFGGVNTAGYDFGMGTDGTVTTPYVAPPDSQYPHFAAEGVNLFRIPFAWQSMTPTLGGPLNETFMSEYMATVNSALSSGSNVHVILDVHNYARWNGEIIGQGGPTNDQFASMWSLVATAFASQSRVIFGIMNEPHDLNSVSEWATSVQAAVNAIRAAGATTQILLMPGSSYASAQMLPTEAGPYLLEVTDPIGGTDLLLFDVHKYLDSDNSGTNADCVTNNVAVLTTLVEWLQSNGNRQALLSETGGGNTQSCITDIAQELAYIQQNSDSIIGFSIWAAGAFATDYVLSVTPNSDGTDQPLWAQAVVPYLP